MKTLALLTILTLTGCASYNPYKDMNNFEKVWQVAHLADVAQTISIARDPDCYFEDDPITRRLIGRHPKVVNAFLWGVSTSYLHAQGSQWLDRNTTIPEGIKILISAIDIGFKINTVHDNYTIGLSFGTKNRHINNPCTSKFNAVDIREALPTLMPYYPHL